MPKVLIGADVGGTKTAVAVSRDGRIVGRADGPGAAVRPGRALASSSTIAEVVRQALSAAGLLLGDVLVVGAVWFTVSVMLVVVFARRLSGHSGLEWLAPIGRLAWPWYVPLGTLLAVSTGIGLSYLPHGTDKASAADERR